VNVYVVTPCFNAGDVIDRTVASVLLQSGDVDIHYHVQDGGSDDDTVERVKRWIGLCERGDLPLMCRSVTMTMASESDAGMYDAIFRSFERQMPLSRDWMTWINAGDVLTPSACPLLVRVEFDEGLRHQVHWLTGAAATSANDVQTSHSDRFHSSEIIEKGLADGRHWHFVQQEGTFFRGELWNSVDIRDGFAGLRRAGDWNLWRMFAELEEIHQFRYPLGTFAFAEGQQSQALRSEYESEISGIVPEEHRRDAFYALDADELVARFLRPELRSAELHLDRVSATNAYKFIRGKLES
tara:strand:- start:16864 stop:17754 length:891 start_codon:yes stop_codon:yes gene_type:complete